MIPPLVLPLVATMAARLPCLSVSVFVYLLLGSHVHASHGSPALVPLPPSYDASICSESFMCGSVNISYPFYLSNATREMDDNKSNHSCGYTDLEISCRGEGPKATPVIRLGGDNYTVLNISYDSYTITLADSDVLGDSKCPAIHHGVNFSDVRWLHTSNSNVNLTFAFDCDPDVPPRGYGKYRIHCDGINSPFGGATSFVFTPDDDKDDEHELATFHCNKVITVPVNSSFLAMAKNDRTKFTSGGYGDVLKHGFELVWIYTTRDQCYQQCEQSGGRCIYSQDSEFLSCLCSDDTVGNPNCPDIKANKKASASSSGYSVSPDPWLFAIIRP